MELTIEQETIAKQEIKITQLEKELKTLTYMVQQFKKVLAEESNIRKTGKIPSSDVPW